MLVTVRDRNADLAMNKEKRRANVLGVGEEK